MKRLPLGLALATTLAGTLALSTPATAQQIDTHDQGSYLGTASVGDYNYGVDTNGDGFGPDRTSYNLGQTFVTPAGSPILNDFSFWIGADARNYNPTDALFRAFVLEWDGANGRPTGSVLYTSDLQSGTGNVPPELGGSDPWTKYTFDTGDLTLDSAKQYLVLLSSVMEGGASTGQGAFNLLQVRTDSYSMGYVVYGNSLYLDPTESASVLTDFDNTSDSQGSFYLADPRSYDLAFAANFSSPTTVTPEPVSMVLLATGLFGVGVVRRRRQKATELA